MGESQADRKSLRNETADDAANQLDYQLPTVRKILNTYRRMRDTGALALTTDG